MLDLTPELKEAVSLATLVFVVLQCATTVYGLWRMILANRAAHERGNRATAASIRAETAATMASHHAADAVATAVQAAVTLNEVVVTTERLREVVEGGNGKHC